MASNSAKDGVRASLAWFDATKQRLQRGGVSLGLALGLGMFVGACGSTDESDEPGASQVGEAPVRVSAEGYSLNASTEDDGANDKANGCSIVQWCNRPDHPDGTVCQLQPGCCNDTGVNECIRESYTVCGSPVADWVYYCR